MTPAFPLPFSLTPTSQSVDARVVDVDEVHAFFVAHPHPNVLEPLANPESKRFVALYDGDDVVATATLEPRALGFVQLGGVMVHPERRGEGLGRPLMDAVCEEARVMGGRRIVCGVYRRDPDVTPYYRAMGFRTILPYIPGARSRAPLGGLARALAKLFRVEAGPDPIRVMARRP